MATRHVQEPDCGALTLTPRLPRTSDPTVSFSEGMNFYNALRYNRKTAFMVAYPGEGHGLRGLANRRDLTIRHFQFFDHYLKGAPAPEWMTEEVPFLMKDQVREPR